MATVTEAPASSEAGEMPYPITSDVYFDMVERGLIPVGYPEGRDVALVVEVAVTCLSADLGPRLARYAGALPLASYVVADVPHRQLLIHAGPRGDGYDERAVVGPGAALRLRLDGADLEPIPYEELMR